MTTERETKVKLPKWTAVHRQLSVEYASPDFLEEVTEKVTEGYVTVHFDDKPPYLVVISRGAVYEVGRIKKEHKNQNIGRAYESVGAAEVERVFNGDKGKVNVYELPAEVAENVCKVMNSETKYGDLKTNIVDVDEVFEVLAEDSFSGSVVFTNSSNYSYVELEGGEVVNCWHRGDAGCSTVDDLRDTRFEEGMEVNIFQKGDIEESGRSVLREGGTVNRDPEEDTDEPDYDAICDALSGTAEEMVGRRKFEKGLSDAVSDVDDISFEHGRLVSRGADSRQVFECIRKGVEREVTMVPSDKIFEEARDEIESIEGGEEFLRVQEER